MSMLFYLMMHIFAIVNLKYFGCVSTMGFLDACLVPAWEGTYLRMGKLDFRAFGLILGYCYDLWRQV